MTYKAEEKTTEAAKEETSAASAWVPCEERLPNDGEMVLANVIKPDAPNEIMLTKSARQCYERGWINAWMPLPDPYREKEPDPDCAWR